MKFICLIMTVMAGIGFTGIEPGFGDTEWAVQQTYRFKQEPLDAAMSAKGRWVYVLTDNGSVMVYDRDGELKDTVSVGGRISAIRAGRTDEELLLIDAKKKTVQRILLSFYHDIDISGSPSKGAADASVVMVVFDDFQ